MTLWEPERCCCFTRRTGCLILGALAVIAALLSLLSVVHHVATINLEEFTHNMCHHPEFKDWDKCVDILPIVVQGVLIFVAVCSVISLILYSMLIHAVRKDIPCLMVPVMVSMVIKLALLILVGVVAVITLATLSHLAMELGLVLYGGLAFLEAYYLLVVRAYYIELRRGIGEAHHVLVEAPFDEEYETKCLKTAA